MLEDEPSLEEDAPVSVEEEARGGSKTTEPCITEGSPLFKIPAVGIFPIKSLESAEPVSLIYAVLGKSDKFNA